jgi:hypothetical protein
VKIALYIEDGLEQIVLTPTSDTEEAILEKIHDGSRQLSIKRGEFYGCAGGWVRQRKKYNSPYYSDEPNDKSTMIILTPAPEQPPAHQQVTKDTEASQS